MRRPHRDEAADYYFLYIDQVEGTDILGALASQREDVVRVLRGVPEEKAGHRYAPDKWILREVVGHINDTERLFCRRAFWFARGFDSPLPSFDQNVAIAEGRFNDRSWSSLIDEFVAVRDADADLLRAAFRPRPGIAAASPAAIRFPSGALAFLGAGHVTHHLEIVKSRYLV